MKHLVCTSLIKTCLTMVNELHSVLWKGDSLINNGYLRGVIKYI